MDRFHTELGKSQHIVCLTGAGISAESGIPTFRGAGGFWGKYSATELATLEAFQGNPSLVWQFYAYRRETVLKAQPNPGHLALSGAERCLEKSGKKLTIVTQNIDGLHQRAGSQRVIEIHGSLFKTRCMVCEKVEQNMDVSICPALAGARPPDPDEENRIEIPEKDLPRCKHCSGLLRPHVVWFGENLDAAVLDDVYRELDACDLCLVIGTSSLVYPAAMFAPHVAARGTFVAEFNIELPVGFGNSDTRFSVQGPSGVSLPVALAPLLTETKEPDT
ncbi:NAD-dependent protein deacylase sirtuin-5, mitochondrial [Hypsibius exemplaris]|uniref:NAD-dependent protein deacylase n=1 Tax=Hypsibius exemplaris TaxID=2072580 RepID=A0A1W0WH17_HYPEX|nr:NAD-dependent protein deacylase sirtuin-5, mitochondrial [Hypsibius exemplaris]